MPVDITLKTITKARLDAKGARVNITDSRGRGLVLRGGPEGLVWGHRVQLGGKPCRMVLGTVDRWTIAEARAIADAATDYAKTHKRAPDDAWLQAHLVATGKIAAPALANDSAGGFPTFAEGRKEYLQYLTGHLKPATIASYKGFLEHAAVRVLDDRRLPTVTRDDVREIVIAVHAGGHERTAEAIVSAIRPLFSFLGEDGRRKRYGVEPGTMASLQAPPRTLTDDDGDRYGDDPWSDGYIPEISELGRIIAVARTGLMTPIVGSAVELTCWTVQRRSTIVSARIRDFIDLGDGTGLWNVPASARKGTRRGKKGRPHTIPLPAPAWDCVKRAYEAAVKRDPNTKWLFPAARPRRAGDEVAHMHASTLTHRFLDIPGCGASPHDVRRTMGTHGEGLLGFSRVDTGTIMDHTEGKKASERITSRTAGTGTDDVTGAHYSLHDGTHHTWPVMRAWCEAVDSAIMEATERMEPMIELARGYGDRLYRAGVGPLIPIGVLTTEDKEEREAAYRGRLGRILGEAVPESEDA